MSGGDAPPSPGGGGDDRRLATLQRLLALEATDLPGALRGAANVLVDVLDSAKLDAFIHDPVADSLVALGVSDTPMGRKQREIGMDSLPLTGDGRMVEVFRTGHSYLAADAQQDLGVERGFREGLGIRALLAVPLVVDGARRGLLQVADTAPGRFDEADRAFLQMVARWVGLVAHRAELVERLTREAAAAARRRIADDLIAVVAHDLRNHLAPLKGQLDLIRRRAERDGRARDIGSAASALGRLARLERLVTDLLDAGRLERGLFALDRREVDLVALAREAADDLERGTTPIALTAPVTLVASVDPDRLRQALENLLANAVRYAPPGTAVDLALGTETRADRPWAVVTVTDAGPGIPPERLDALFGRYAPGPESTGLGLGLYLASRVAAAHGGTLTVETAPGAGARFHLAVLLQPDSPADGADVQEGV